MSQLKTQSSSTTPTSGMGNHKRGYFALLAKVGALKRKLSLYLGEMEHYSTTAIELLVLSSELLRLLEEQDLRGLSKRKLLRLSSKHTRLTRCITHYYTPSTESQERLSTLLNYDGLEMAMDTSEEGYVSPSMDQILRNMGRALEVTREERPRISFNSLVQSWSANHGSSLRDDQTPW